MCSLSDRIIPIERHDIRMFLAVTHDRHALKGVLGHAFIRTTEGESELPLHVLDGASIRFRALGWFADVQNNHEGCAFWNTQDAALQQLYFMAQGADLETA